MEKKKEQYLEYTNHHGYLGTESDILPCKLNFKTKFKLAIIKLEERAELALCIKKQAYL